MQAVNNLIKTLSQTINLELNKDVGHLSTDKNFRKNMSIIVENCFKDAKKDITPIAINKCITDKNFKILAYEEAKKELIANFFERRKERGHIAQTIKNLKKEIKMIQNTEIYSTFEKYVESERGRKNFELWCKQKMTITDLKNQLNWNLGLLAEVDKELEERAFRNDCVLDAIIKEEK